MFYYSVANDYYGMIKIFDTINVTVSTTNKHNSLIWIWGLSMSHRILCDEDNIIRNTRGTSATAASTYA